MCQASRNVDSDRPTLLFSMASNSMFSTRMHSEAARLTLHHHIQFGHLSVQAIEFWSTLAEMEVMFQEEDDEAGVTSGGGGGENQHFLDRCAAELTPLLLDLLLLQHEDQDNDDTDWCDAPEFCPLLFFPCRSCNAFC